MASQYDFQSGLDLSSLSSVSQAQLMQAINQLAPLSNIGGVIVQAATNANNNLSDDGTGGTPDVANNPRFARYIWANTFTDPPTYYRYDTSNTNWVWWSAGTITAATQISDNIITLAKLYTTGVTAKQVMRMNTGGTALEWVNPSSIFTPGSNEVLLTYLNVAGGFNGQILALSGTTPTWTTLAAENYITSLAISKLTAGSTNYILRTGASGPEWADYDDTASGLLKAASVNLSKLHPSGAISAGYLPRYSGTAWAATIPKFDIFPTSSFLDAAVALDTQTCNIDTGLSTAPKLIRVVARCVSNDAATNYYAGDLIDTDAFGTAAGAVSAPLRVSMQRAGGTGNYIIYVRRPSAATGISVAGGGTENFAAPTSFANFQIRAFLLP